MADSGLTKFIEKRGIAEKPDSITKFLAENPPVEPELAPELKKKLAQIQQRPVDFSAADIARTFLAKHTKDGAVDFNGLRADFNSLAQRAASFDPHYSSAVRAGDASQLNASWNNKYNLALRKELGIVEKGWLEGLFSNPITYACKVPGDIDFNDLNNGLGANGVTCKLKDTSAGRSS